MIYSSELKEMQTMEMIQEKRNNISILALNGKLDTNTSAQLERKLLELIDSNEKL